MLIDAATIYASSIQGRPILGMGGHAGPALSGLMIRTTTRLEVLRRAVDPARVAPGRPWLSGGAAGPDSAGGSPNAGGTAPGGRLHDGRDARVATGAARHGHHPGRPRRPRGCDPPAHRRRDGRPPQTSLAAACLLIGDGCRCGSKRVPDVSACRREYGRSPFECL